MTTESALLYSFATLCLVQVVYFLFVFRKLAAYRPQDEPATPHDQAVSVIICAHNERENLKVNLPLVLNQGHTVFEVVVVDDQSTDGTSEWLADMAKHHDKLRVVPHLGEGGRGKKFPLTTGIKAAQHEILLLTDADCRPSGEDWVTRMTAPLTRKLDMVLGYGPYEKRKGWVNMLVRFDTFLTALQYISFALSGRPYMGVGRNLAYKKKLFDNAGGFSSHLHRLSGDDDLFVNQAARMGKVAVRMHPDARTFSMPSRHWSEWIHQKRRHFSVGPDYKTLDKILLGGYLSSQTFFYLLAVGLPLYGILQPVYYIALSLRMICMLMIFKLCMNKLGVSDLFLISPVLDLFFAFFYPVIFLTGFVHKTHSWKTD